MRISGTNKKLKRQRFSQICEENSATINLVLFRSKSQKYGNKIIKSNETILNNNSKISKSLNRKLIKSN